MRNKLVILNVFSLFYISIFSLESILLTTIAKQTNYVCFTRALFRKWIQAHPTNYRNVVLLLRSFVIHYVKLSISNLTCFIAYVLCKYLHLLYIYLVDKFAMALLSTTSNSVRSWNIYNKENNSKLKKTWHETHSFCRR